MRVATPICCHVFLHANSRFRFCRRSRQATSQTRCKHGGPDALMLSLQPQNPSSAHRNSDNHRSVEQASGAWKSSWVKTLTSLPTEMTSVSGEMNSVTRCWTDTSAPKRTSSRSSPCGRRRPCTHLARPVAPCVNGATSVGHCGRSLCLKPFIKAHLFLSSVTPISVLSSHSEAHPTLPLNLCASQKDFELEQ